MKRKNSIVYKIIISLLLLAVICTPLFANASYIGTGSPTLSVTCKKPNYNDVFMSLIEAATNAWNTSGCGANITMTTGSCDNKLYAGSYPDSWYGLNTPWVNPYKFEIKINTRTITNDATNYNNFVMAVIVHEFGHVYWLADNPNTQSSSIMKYNNNGMNYNTTWTPQQFDIYNVMAAYNQK